MKQDGDGKRMKRRLIPPIATCLLWVIGYAVGAAFHQRDVPLIAACSGCYLTGQLIRNKTIPDKACEAEWGKEAPRRWLVGRCARYQCEHGYYYQFEGWEAMPNESCTDVIMNDPTTCPGASCIYIPMITELWGFDRVTLQPSEVAKINRGAMALK
jgi:hypothetical protein